MIFLKTIFLSEGEKEYNKVLSEGYWAYAVKLAQDYNLSEKKLDKVKRRLLISRNLLDYIQNGDSKRLIDTIVEKIQNPKVRSKLSKDTKDLYFRALTRRAVSEGKIEDAMAYARKVHNKFLRANTLELIAAQTATFQDNYAYMINAITEVPDREQQDGDLREIIWSQIILGNNQKAAEISDIILSDDVRVFCKKIVGFFLNDENKTDTEKQKILKRFEPNERHFIDALIAARSHDNKAVENALYNLPEGKRQDYITNVASAQAYAGYLKEAMQTISIFKEIDLRPFLLCEFPYEIDLLISFIRKQDSIASEAQAPFLFLAQDYLLVNCMDKSIALLEAISDEVTKHELLTMITEIIDEIAECANISLCLDIINEDLVKQIEHEKDISQAKDSKKDKVESYIIQGTFPSVLEGIIESKGYWRIKPDIYAFFLGLPFGAIVGAGSAILLFGDISAGIGRIFGLAVIFIIWQKSKDYFKRREVLSYHKRMIRKNPANMKSRLFFVGLYSEAEQWSEAIKWAKEAAKIDFRCMYLLANTLRKSGDSSQASKVMQELKDKYHYMPCINCKSLTKVKLMEENSGLCSKCYDMQVS